MPLPRIESEALKAILENLQNPESLDSHAWAGLTFVKEAVARLPSLREASPGRRLAVAVEALFYETMPGAPPRRGKRIDTRWGEFGLLAAQYFAPIRFGTRYPASMRDAWGRIDKSILLYVFGREHESLPESQTSAYKLVAEEPEVAPNSTLSDWHRKGIEKLLETIQTRERYLADHPLEAGEGNAAAVAEPDEGRGRGAGGRVRSGRARKVALATLALILLACVWGAFKVRRMYDQATVVLEDVARLRDLTAGGASVETARAAGPALQALREDYLVLKSEAAPFLWMGPLFGWVPVYGGDLASIRDLATLSDSMLAAADISYQALTPLLDAMDETSASSGLDPARLAMVLSEAQPQLLEAQKEVERAVEARRRIDVDRLSPRVRDLVVKYVDRTLPWMQDGVILAVEFPRLVGASSEGPKTYLLLAQNEDEIRPTGGFITAAGTLLLDDGQIRGISFVNTGNLDDWRKPYPSAPWQLQQYMNSPVLVLRDTNWFTDYPTAALYAESLYSYISDHSVDGVIAFDQHLLIEILRVVGPIQVEGVPEPIGADNVVEYMRAQKVPPGGSSNPNRVNWDSKAFINTLTSVLLARVSSGDLPFEQLSLTLFSALDEHHVLIQVDNPALTAVAVRRGWDGAVRPGQGDFLMAVDSNVGFNKTNAVVESRLAYEADLFTLEGPSGKLSVTHTNHAAPIKCVPAGYLDYWNIEDKQYWESDYPIDRCYWNYLRVYTVLGAELLQANPQTIPADWMLRRQAVPPQVDVLKEEEIQGVAGFGLLKVVPGGETVETNLRFGLPASVVRFDAGTGVWSYHLRVQKQPGTVAVPLTIRVRLPEGAVVLLMPEGAVEQEGVIVLETDLRLDLELTVQFTLP
jgi:hypothetical protein